MRFKKAKKKFDSLIKYAARRYAVQGHYKLSREELVAEGQLVLVRCWNEFPMGETRFSKYFKSALYHRIHSLHRHETQQKRNGLQIALDDTGTILQTYRSIPYLHEALSVLPHISPRSRRLLHTLLLSPPGLTKFALRDYRNRQKRLGAPKFRIAPRHIRGYLRLTPNQLQESVKEIREIYRSLP